MKCGVCYFLAGSAARMHQLVKAAPPPACSILQSCLLVLVLVPHIPGEGGLAAAAAHPGLILGSSAAGWNSAVRVLLYMTYGTAIVDSVLILSVFNPPLSEEKEGWVFPGFFPGSVNGVYHCLAYPGGSGHPRRTHIFV